MGLLDYKRIVKDVRRDIRLEQDELASFNKQLEADFTLTVGCNMAMMKHVDALYKEAEKEHAAKIADLDSIYKSFRDKKVAFRDSFSKALDSNEKATKERRSNLGETDGMQRRRPSSSSRPGVIERIGGEGDIYTERLTVLRHWTVKSAGRG